MIEYYLANPKYMILMIILIIGTLCVCFKAVQASIRRSRENQKIIDKLTKEKNLREKFSVLTEEIIESADNSELLNGVGLNLQKRVADKADMNSEYESLNEYQKKIYSFVCLVQDSEETLEDFFRANGQPVLGECKTFFNEVCDDHNTVSLFNSVYDSFDEDNEECSFDINTVCENCKKFTDICPSLKLSEMGGKYIKANKMFFLTK